jgi:hypothetical protein
MTTTPASMETPLAIALGVVFGVCLLLMVIEYLEMSV